MDTGALSLFAPPPRSHSLSTFNLSRALSLALLLALSLAASLSLALALARSCSHSRAPSRAVFVLSSAFDTVTVASPPSPQRCDDT